VFDARSYRDAVVLPLQKNAAQQSVVAEVVRGINDADDDAALSAALTRTDIAALFAITPGMSDADLAQHLKSVEMFLNKGMPAVSKILAQLLKALKQQVPNSSSAAFWDRSMAAVAASGQRKLQAFGAAVRHQETLGIIAADRLRKAASAYGLPGSVSDKELADAVGAQGVHVCPDFDAPRVSLAAAPLKKDLHVAFRSIIDVVLLHDREVPRASGIQVIDRLSFEGATGRRTITLTDVEKSMTAASTKSDDATESAKKTLNAISQKCATDSDLQHLALSWFLDLADSLVRKQGLMLVPALDSLVNRGLADLDAKRVLSKATSTNSGPDLTDVRDLIAAGDLQSARRLMASLLDGQGGPDQSPLFTSVAAALKEAEAQKQLSLDDYRQAMQSQEHGKAHQALSQALTIDREDAEIPRLLEQLPPATPTGFEVSFSLDAGGVELSWRGNGAADVRYAVVRGESGTPANPKSGREIVAATVEQKALDREPLVARQVTYAVFAFKQGADYSLPAAAQITVLPPPTGVDTAVTSKDVSVFWRVPAQALGVSVDLVKADGLRKSFPPSSGDRLLIDGLVLGEKYTVTLTAHYLVNGRQERSEAVSVDATPRGTARPVTDLMVTNIRMPDGRPGVRAEWTESPGHQVDLWSLPIDADVRTGTRLPATALDDLSGRRVVGTVRASGSRQAMVFYAIQDVRAILAVTPDGAGVLVGNSVTAGSAPPPSNVQAIRYGSVLVVSWHWPHGDYRMDLNWTSDDGKTGRTRVDRLAYKRDGGVRIPDADQIIELSVATVAAGGGREYVFAPITIQLEAAAPTLSYALKLPRGLFGGRQAEVAVTSPNYRGVADLVAVLAPGTFMPARASSGQEVARLPFDFRTEVTRQATFPVPKIKRPYWVRLFPAIDGQFFLEDPPTDSMKG
jgi:hypothetical protein